MYAKPWGIAPPPAAAGEQCYVAGHRRGAQQAHPNVWYRTAFLKCQMANGLKAVNHCVQLKRNVLRQSSAAQSYQGSDPVPPLFLTMPRFWKHGFIWFGVNYGLWINSSLTQCPAAAPEALLPHAMGTYFFKMGTQFWVKWGPNGDLCQQIWGLSTKEVLENVRETNKFRFRFGFHVIILCRRKRLHWWPLWPHFENIAEVNRKLLLMHK